MGYDFNRQIEIPDHASDDGELLEILFTKHCGVAAGQVEKFQNHRANPVEMTGTGRAAQMFREQCLCDRDGSVGEIHFTDIRHEHAIGTVGLADGQIFVFRSRVVFEIGGFIELDGIDENGNQHRAGCAGLFSSEVDECGVSGMERAHRGYQYDRTGQGIELVLKFGFRAGDPHGLLLTGLAQDGETLAEVFDGRPNREKRCDHAWVNG